MFGQVTSYIFFKTRIWLLNDLCSLSTFSLHTSTIIVFLGLSATVPSILAQTIHLNVLIPITRTVVCLQRTKSINIGLDSTAENNFYIWPVYSSKTTFWRNGTALSDKMPQFVLKMFVPAKGVGKDRRFIVLLVQSKINIIKSRKGCRWILWTLLSRKKIIIYCEQRQDIVENPQISGRVMFS